ncbi:MAG: class I SAM-dependent methyltransferase [Bacteroidetes bacterium]|nr:class I SAM-dependent methyltransferase [Bacteroidota bacterium]
MEYTPMENAIHIAIKNKPGRCERIVLKHLRRMDKGRIDLELPNGNHLVIGDGHGAQAQMRIRDAAFYKRCILYGKAGLGEAYADGLWDSENITSVISWAMQNTHNSPWWRRITRRPVVSPDDLTNDLYRLFLDETMSPSAAYFEHDGMDLEEAQHAKYQRLCLQLRLQPTDHVLDIGCGWGGGAIHIATHYGCKVTALTTSEEQYQLASKRVRQAGLGHLVSILKKDYREMNSSFDNIVSVEIAQPADPTYFRKCRQLLKQEGIMAMQKVTRPGTRYTAHQSGEMALIDLKELGLHYAATLRVWFMHFNSRLAQVRQLGFDDRFIRKWNYYLCHREAAFRTRRLHVVQLVYQPSR